MSGYWPVLMVLPAFVPWAGLVLFVRFRPAHGRHHGYPDPKAAERQQLLPGAAHTGELPPADSDSPSFGLWQVSTGAQTPAPPVWVNPPREVTLAIGWAHAAAQPLALGGPAGWQEPGWMEQTRASLAPETILYDSPGAASVPMWAEDALEALPGEDEGTAATPPAAAPPGAGDESEACGPPAHPAPGPSPAPPGGVSPRSGKEPPSMTNLDHRCADSAFPAALHPFPASGSPLWAVQGYLSGPTPHVWSGDEWASFGSRPKYPMAVASLAVGDPAAAVAEAFDALEQAYRIGQPPGTVIGWDMETAIARAKLENAAAPGWEESSDWPGRWETSIRATHPGYLTRVHAVLTWAGFRMWVYGSASTVFACPPCDGYDVADWTGAPHFTGHQHERACQYADAAQTGGNWDARVIKEWSWQHLLWK